MRLQRYQQARRDQTAKTDDRKKLVVVGLLPGVGLTAWVHDPDMASLQGHPAMANVLVADLVSVPSSDHIIRPVIAPPLEELLELKAVVMGRRGIISKHTVGSLVRLGDSFQLRFQTQVCFLQRLKLHEWCTCSSPGLPKSDRPNTSYPGSKIQIFQLLQPVVVNQNFHQAHHQ